MAAAAYEAIWSPAPDTLSALLSGLVYPHHGEIKSNSPLEKTRNGLRSPQVRISTPLKQAVEAPQTLRSEANRTRVSETLRSSAVSCLADFTSVQNSLCNTMMPGPEVSHGAGRVRPSGLVSGLLQLAGGPVARKLQLKLHSISFLVEAWQELWAGFLAGWPPAGM